MVEVADSGEIDPCLKISPGSFERLSEFITRELGIKMSEAKVSMIQSRLSRRVRELGLKSIDQYCEHLFSPEGTATERAHFFNAVTTNKTDFFREAQHFAYLVEAVIPRLTSALRGRPLKVWSAACSSGEEPYTLAMILSRYAESHPEFSFGILGTDISTRVLQLGKEGIYTRPQVAPIPNELRRKYLLQCKQKDLDLVRIVPALRQTVSFHQLNLMDEEYAVREEFDVIFCRNVLIYFSRDTQQGVIRKLCRHLRKGGYLFVGHSESLSGMSLPLVSMGSSVFKKSCDEDEPEVKIR